MSRGNPRLMRNTAVLTNKLKNEKAVDDGHDVAETSVPVIVPAKLRQPGLWVVSRIWPAGRC
jgi:hypothetical protein